MDNYRSRRFCAWYGPSEVTDFFRGARSAGGLPLVKPHLRVKRKRGPIPYNVASDWRAPRRYVSSGVFTYTKTHRRPYARGQRWLNNYLESLATGEF